MLGLATALHHASLTDDVTGPFVQTTSKVAPAAAIRILQQALPPNINQSRQDTVELENVPPAQLLAPRSADSLLHELSTGAAGLGDRVVHVGRAGPAPLGARGTVVGVHEDDLEVMFDVSFPGGNDLQGRCAALS